MKGDTKRKGRIFCAAAVLALGLTMFLGSCLHGYTLQTEAAPASGDGVTRHGSLRVEMGRLVDKEGNLIQLRGMSSHGLTWFPEYTNALALRSIKEHGANVFRAAMYADSSNGGYNAGERERGLNKALLYAAVDNALGEDMYVIADWHIFEDKTPLLHADEAVAFFAELSARYANKPGVLYEICNEPNGATTWADIKAYAARVIPAIRANAPDAVILVGTPKFSSDLNSAIEEPLPYENILYSFHLYTGLYREDYANVTLLERAMKAGVPVFVTEWGIGTDRQTGKLAVDEALEFIAFLRRHKISWVNWSLCNKAEDYSAIRPDCDKLSNWEPEDLTVSGRIVFDALKG